MTITREQVADLQPGDVVEVSWPEGTVLRGPVHQERPGRLVCEPIILRHESGNPPSLNQRATLTVVSRAPRPLYVNHPRTSPVPGDVVRDADGDDPMRVWLTSCNEDGDTWWVDNGADWVDKSGLPKRLRLLVDGETGQVVP